MSDYERDQYSLMKMMNVKGRWRADVITDVR